MGGHGNFGWKGGDQERARLLRSVSFLALSSTLVAVGIAATRGGAKAARSSPRLSELELVQLPHVAVRRSLLPPADWEAAAVGALGGGREEQLVSVSGSSSNSPTEAARCVGLLHSCQTWLELKDGKMNSIVITSPDDANDMLINKNVSVPASGSKLIGGDVWKVLQGACKYGLSDLSECEPPSHWPSCTGASCK